jgi:hypothetical protein
MQGAPVERRQQDRRLAARQPSLSVSDDMDDRRLGLGRRWDDWRRRQDAA